MGCSAGEPWSSTREREARSTRISSKDVLFFSGVGGLSLSLCCFSIRSGKKKAKWEMNIHGPLFLSLSLTPLVVLFGFLSLPSVCVCARDMCEADRRAETQPHRHSTLFQPKGGEGAKKAPKNEALFRIGFAHTITGNQSVASLPLDLIIRRPHPRSLVVMIRNKTPFLSLSDNF